jgi:hypothetical protein
MIHKLFKIVWKCLKAKIFNLISFIEVIETNKHQLSDNVKSNKSKSKEKFYWNEYWNEIGNINSSPYKNDELFL